MCFQSQGLDSWPVKVAHFLNSTFTWKATLSWHLLWSKSSPHENCCPKWCTALCDCWYTLLVEISAAAWLLLCWFDPQISLQPHDSAVFQQQAPSQSEKGCGVPACNSYKLRPAFQEQTYLLHERCVASWGFFLKSQQESCWYPNAVVKALGKIRYSRY